MSHEAHDGEDDEAGKHTGAGVDAANDDGVPEEQEGRRGDWGRLQESGTRGSNLRGKGEGF